jgi:asparagine synthase (glutamine-hydrolysing)
MCGLVVTASFDGRPADPILLKRASDTIMHRGPDDEGLALYDVVGFAFRRLSILDLSPSGHQPMETPDGRLAIVFNGEIYNYLELRQELQQLGHTFRSSSDTEVLLHAYDEWGTDCVSRLNGMWAFVILDKRRNRLVASRDRFGVKPLYRWTDGTRLVLASEIKAIFATGWCRAEVNWETAARFLCRGHEDEDTETFFAHVDQVAPGSILEVDLNGQMRERRFWSLDAIHDDIPADPVARFRELFEDSVRLRMRSDVPVGVCLSGGIDSNAIISMMAKLRPSNAAGPLQAFSYIPEEFSEATYINESVAKTGAELNELHTSARELWDLMPKALWHYDEPVHSPTALIGFQLMRLAKSRGVTVVLNGQGADEVNAGYHSYFRWYWADLMHAGRWGRASAEVSQYCAAQNQSYWPQIMDAAGHWMRTELRRLPAYRSLRGPERIQNRSEARWFSPDLIERLPNGQNRQVTSLSDALAYSVERRPLPLYLRVEDRNSMAHSVEARLPFLDYRLVSLAFSLPGEWKMRGPWNKYIVREAMKGVIAERVRTRLDKMGFPTPGRSWFADAWYEPTRDLLGSRTLRECGVFNVEAATQDLERHRDGQVDVSSGLFHLSQFGVWLDSMSGAGGATPPQADIQQPVSAVKLPA